MSHKSKKQGPGKLGPRAGIGGRPPRGGGVGKGSGWPGIQVAGICAALIAIVFAVYGQCIGFGFVDYDDPQYVTDNPMVSKGLSAAGIRWALFYGGIGHWHPLAWLSHMLDCDFYGLWAGGHHLTNVILHALTAAGLCLVLLRMTRAPWRCAFVAAAWAIHPLRAESVAWIAERKDVLSGLFFVLTLGAYVHWLSRPSVLRYTLIAVCFSLGLLSKNMLITLPCVLLVLDYWPLGRIRENSRIVPLIREKIPLFVLSAISGIITFLVPEKLPAADHLPAWLRVENAIVSCCIYLRQTLWPAGLSADYPNPRHGFSLWTMAGSAGVLCVIFAAAFGLRKRHPALLAGWLWFTGMLVPVIGLAQISHYAHADRYTYLPQIGLWIAGTWTVADWAGERHGTALALGAAAAAVLCALIIAARKQVSYWHDSGGLWAHAIECVPDSPVAHNNLGTCLLQRGEKMEALAQFQTALRIDPGDAEAHNNIGYWLMGEGQTAEAVAQYREAVRIFPENAAGHNGLGLALLGLGETGEAIDEFRTALKYDPDYAKAHNNLGDALLREHRIGEAAAEFRAALKIDPEYGQAHGNLGKALLLLGQSAAATAEYREESRIDPGDPEAHLNLGNVLFQQGDAAGAIAEYRAALQADPRCAEAAMNLGNVMLQEGDAAAAIEQYRESARANPGYAPAHNNLGHALMSQGRIPEAVAEYRKAVELNPKYAEAEYNLGSALLEVGEETEARARMEKALALSPGNSIIENRLAWLLATARQSALRDGSRAVDLATKASVASGGNNPVVLRTLAAAYAQAGDFPKAVESAQRALQLAQSGSSLAGELQREIKGYEARQAFQ